jgi:sensor histidine kinase regulating citrate/malate metabolism
LLEAPHQVTFETPTKMPKADINTEVLDSVVDNLVQNALEKAKLETDIHITVRLLATEHFCLEVFDTGSAIPNEIAARLFKTHVSSKNGLGVGLYHAAQQARQAGYEICVYENRLSFVCFRLEKLS